MVLLVLILTLRQASHRNTWDKQSDHFKGKTSFNWWQSSKRPNLGLNNSRSKLLHTAMKVFIDAAEEKTLITFLYMSIISFCLFAKSEHVLVTALLPVPVFAPICELFRLFTPVSPCSDPQTSYQTCSIGTFQPNTRSFSLLPGRGSNRRIRACL